MPIITSKAGGSASGFGGLITFGTPFAPSSAYASIATTTVGGGGASSITFSSIPSTYTHLQIRGIVKTTGSSADSLYCYPLSGVTTTSDYSDHGLYGDGSSAIARSATSSATVASFVGAVTSASNVFGTIIIDVLDYTNTNKTRVLRTLGGYDANGSGYVGLFSFRGGGTSAISSLTFNMNNNFAQYSSFALYGIKGA